MNTLYRTLAIVGALLFVIVGIPACTLNSSRNALVTRDENVLAKNASLLSVYQKRSDLVPNLVKVVEAFAGQERGVLTDVVRARAQASSVTLPANATQADLDKFAAAQAQLSAGLGRLLAVSEAYPDLKSNANFLKLQEQITQLETQATAARNVYIREVQAFNTTARAFPSNIAASLFGFPIKAQLKFDNEDKIKQSPTVEFGKK